MNFFEIYLIIIYYIMVFIFTFLTFKMYKQIQDCIELNRKMLETLKECNKLNIEIADIALTSQDLSLKILDIKEEELFYEQDN